MQVRGATREDTWESYANDWERVAAELKKFLDAYNSVFPRVFWDIRGAMMSLIPRYPAVFWKVFWAYHHHETDDGAPSPPNPSSSHISYFKDYLTNTIAATLLSGGDGSIHRAYSDRAMQHHQQLDDGLKRKRDDDEDSDEASDRFAQQMRSLTMMNRGH